MKTTDLYYDLPAKLIAQEPAIPRGTSKLLVLNRTNKIIKHRQFFEIGNYLKLGDLLVVNDTKVLPAKLKGIKEKTKAKVEVLLLTEKRKDTWEVLARPAKRFKIKSIINFHGGLTSEVIKILKDGRRLIKFKEPGLLLKRIKSSGEIPLPPYIKKPLAHPEHYQTVYAKKEESAAAPTAGLHFSHNLIASLKKQGIEFANITLKIGLDTFLPIREKTIEAHRIHSEYFEVSQKTANMLNLAKQNNRRIIAVGTTSARVLETLKDEKTFKKMKSSTKLFIYPGYKFKVIDAIITNFHLPKTTLLAMVSAFAGIDTIKEAYTEAINKNYRFFSFGDAMMIF